jgi:hypothetical protein
MEFEFLLYFIWPFKLVVGLGGGVYGLHRNMFSFHPYMCLKETLQIYVAGFTFTVPWNVCK